jgi:hypothetical protein
MFGSNILELLSNIPSIHSIYIEKFDQKMFFPGGGGKTSQIKKLSNGMITLDEIGNYI